jgi:fluoroacetyl-CoA thioesterase
MDLTEIIQSGMVEELTLSVEEQHTASHVGSGALRVLATPVMIAWMERASLRLLVNRLPAGQSSVGVRVEISHLAPTPQGFTVRVRSEVVAVEGFKVTFHVEAWDEIDKIGEGLHQRVVIDEARFLKRGMNKQSQLFKESPGK